MMSDTDRTAYIAQMAETLGLTLPDAEAARVKFMFAVLERAAGQLRDAPILGDTVSAAVFHPWPEQR